MLLSTQPLYYVRASSKLVVSFHTGLPGCWPRRHDSVQILSVTQLYYKLKHHEAPLGLRRSWDLLQTLPGLLQTWAYFNVTAQNNSIDFLTFDVGHFPDHLRPVRQCQNKTMSFIIFMPDSNPHWCYLPTPSIPGRLSPIFDVAQWLAYPFLFPVFLGYPEPYPLSSFNGFRGLSLDCTGKISAPFSGFSPGISAFLLHLYFQPNILLH